MNRAGTLAKFLVILLLGGFNAAGQGNGGLNEWIKPTSGYWEEPFWSLGRLPGNDNDLIAFRNAGWKALAIGANTTANYPGSLMVSNLLVDAPTDSSNQLLLNWGGLEVPLVVRSTLTIGPNGSLESHYSALDAATAVIHGSVSFSDFATEQFARLELWGGPVRLESGTMRCLNLTFIDGTFIQIGGTHYVQEISLPDQNGYQLQGGALISEQVQIGNYWGLVPDTHPYVWQTGGVHTNLQLTMVRADGNGYYRLDQGLLVSSNVSLTKSNSFIQNGGTSLLQKLDLSSGGRFALNGGQVVTAETSVESFDYFPRSLFVQSGGEHTVTGALSLKGSSGVSSEPAYELGGGHLRAPDIRVEGTALSVSSGGMLLSSNLTIVTGTLSLAGQGVVSNTGILTLSNYYYAASITADNASERQYLGRLQIRNGGFLNLHASPVQPTYATVLEFNDSHALPWSGQLLITNWGLHADDHLFIGTNSHGLTAAQLDQIVFLREDANYPALLLSTGELIPMPRNDWTKPGSGNWEEPYWSLGRLPASDQGLVVLGNPGWKSLAITANTTANYPASLSLNNLVIMSPTDSFNQLLLNWAGLDVPLDVHWNLTIGPNASLESHYSALHAANAYIDGSASFSDYSTEDFGNVWLRYGGTMYLTNGAMTCSNLTFYDGTFRQLGGTHVCEAIILPGTPFSYYQSASGFYSLSGGTLISGSIPVGWKIPYGPAGPGSFVQTGGVHTNRSIELRGVLRGPAPGHAELYGFYSLTGGLLVSEAVTGTVRAF